ncbi:2-hydroxyacid dehydrogenase [Paralcaligenes ginsengisoli]
MSVQKIKARIIVAANTDRGTHVWCQAFEQALPGARLIPWNEADEDSRADYALVWKPPGALFRRETRLKAVFNLGAGVDGLLSLPDLPVGLPVVRLEDAGMTEQMVEYVVHGLLRVSREFAAYETQQRALAWKPLRPVEREQWPVGVMGLGAIGLSVAQAIARLGYPVAGWARSHRDIAGISVFAGLAQLPAFLARTRVLVNVLPLTGDTENILNRQNLERLRASAYLINVARGSHLVEQDLLDLLDSGHMQGALLDVFRVEPLPADHPFWRHEKVTVTPHIAAITLREHTVEQIVNKIHSLEQGLLVSGLVSRDHGY